MDFNKIIARAKAMFLSPRTEWPIIAAEPATVGSLFTGYIIILAAIPPIAHFISTAVIGTSSFLGSFRFPMGWALETAVVTYILSLVGVFVSMLIVDALAPSFGGEKNQIQALKVVGYSYSAYWVASVAVIIPALGWLIALAGGIYSIYLLNMGLPFTMKNPTEKSVGYTAVIIIVTIVLYFVIGLVVASITRFSGMNPYGGFMGSAVPTTRQHPNFADGSTGAALQAWAANVDKASKQMDTATKSGNTDAQANAVGAVLGAALGSGGKVESLAPDRIKPFLPDTLDGLKRTQSQVQRGGALGMQLSTGTATYSDGAAHTLNLEITDTGSLKGLVGFAAGYGGAEQDTETDTGYDKLYKRGGQLIHEKWDNRSLSGEYGVVVGDRFSVKVSGNAASIDELKAATSSIDLSGLAALKSEGVQAN